MSQHNSHHFAKAVQSCISEDEAVSTSLAELGLINPRVSVIREKGTPNHQVNVNFDLSDGDNIEGVARKFGIGLLPTLFQHLEKKLEKNGVVEHPKTEFFCIPQTDAHGKDAVVATFSFE